MQGPRPSNGRHAAKEVEKVEEVEEGDASLGNDETNWKDGGKMQFQENKNSLFISTFFKY